MPSRSSSFTSAAPQRVLVPHVDVRIVPVSSIVHPLGDPDLSPGAEKEMRRSVVEKALETLKEGV